MNNKKIIIGNWKMNPQTAKEAEKLFKDVAKSVAGVKNTEIVVCAPFVYISKIKTLSKKIILGAQDAYFGDVGPYTGEVSPEMLYNLGVRYVLIGHSERRALGETNALINQKVKGALTAGLVPVLCVGENLRDANHEYFNVVKTQIEECLKSVVKSSIPKVIIAYEPVWAISSTKDRKDATAGDSKEMVIFIRKVLSGLAGLQVAKDTRIIYGGSVNDRDAGEFLEHGGVDGVLPGKASLDPKKFVSIIKTCEALKN